ncbi:hypothetical protein [Pseudomonas sp.]|uniref:hypothetical protein n=1 Tax=Pseudomonas sp. TaxID=306 RepID=UPI003982619A
MAPEAPYAVPKARLTEPGSQKSGSPIKAVLVGVSVDVIGTLVATLVISALYGVIWALRGLPPEGVGPSMMNSALLSPYKLVLTAAGLGFSVLSGYLCARIAKRFEYLLALIASLISAATPLAIGGMSGGLSLNLTLVLLILLGLCASLTGAHIAVRRHHHLGAESRA